jgi:phosphatidylglycerol:prolipoprotein diacylglycerol transferase
LKRLEFPAWDPVLLDLPGPIDIRWYGLMYIVAFVCAHLIFSRLARRGFLPVSMQAVGDLIVYCVLGTILGGRLGYAIFYDHGLSDPLKLIRIWEGGLSFHGGLVGVCLGLTLFWMRHQKELAGLSIGRLLDSAALAVTPGILAVRCANFVNGELYGRVTDSASFLAMRFPTDETAARLLHLDLLRDYGGKRAEELGVLVAYGKRPIADLLALLPPKDPSGGDWSFLAKALDWNAVKEQVPFRYPSQLFEAAGEGLLTGLVLFATWRLTRSRPLGAFTYGGIFLVMYGVVRFLIENLRQPDRQFRKEGDDLGTVLLGLTMGQTLCVAMIVAGVMMLIAGIKKGPDAQEPEPA